MVDKSESFRAAHDRVDNAVADMYRAGIETANIARQLDEDLRRIKAEVGARGAALGDAVEQSRRLLGYANDDVKRVCVAMKVPEMQDELERLARLLMALGE